MNVLDLFSGIGGFALGFERAGMRTIAFCEIEPYCRAVLQRHWPNVRVYEDVERLCRRVADCDPEDGDGGVRCPRCDEEFGDCACIGTDQFLDETGQPDVICGGFPCVDITDAARPHGDPQGLAGVRSGLWREFARIVGELEPRHVVVENSSAITIRGLLDVLGDLTRLGYDAQWFSLPAAAIGAPHRRTRTFIVAHADGAGSQGAFREELAREIERRRDADLAGSDWIHAASRVLRSAHGVPRGMDRLKAIGNAVVPEVAEVIGTAIINASIAHAGERTFRKGAGEVRLLGEAP